MGHHGDVFPADGLEDVHEPLGVVVMAVGDHNGVDRTGVDAQEFQVVQYREGGLPRVEQDPLALLSRRGLQQDGYAVLGQEGRLVPGVVVEDRDDPR